ncbi:hypothetical protein HY224_03610, partial [Candidatus Uhrbacteria bacterium]|nr:hypothetical protein [Candidatus Uhrbacteria bacterium]
MNLILLPGKNQSNLNWIKDVEQAVKPYFDATAVQYYNHWQEEDQSLIDIDHESSEMYQTCRDWTDYAVFAKSA